MIHLTL